MKIVFLVILIPFLALAQTEYSNGMEWSYSVTNADSGDYDYELPQITAFDDDFTSNPIAYQVKLDTLTADATETEIIGVYIQGYYVDTWTNIDTVVAADTLNGSHTWASATFYGKGLLDMGETITKFSKYRVRVLASSATGQPFAFYIKLYACKRD